MNTPIIKRVQDAMGAQARSAAQQTKNHSAREQKAIEGQISNKYNQELYRKQLEIQSRTYREMGLDNYKGSKTSPEYQRLSGIAAGRVAKRMSNNKGPNEIRAKRDAELAQSRATTLIVTTTKSSEREAPVNQVAKGHVVRTKKNNYDWHITESNKRKREPRYTVTFGCSVNPENLKHALKHGKGTRATKPSTRAKRNVIKY